MSDSALAAARERLFLEGFDFEPAADFADVLGLERRAIEFGYRFSFDAATTYHSGHGTHNPQG